MIFEVTRTSCWDFDKNRPPCKGAVAGIKRIKLRKRVYDYGYKWIDAGFKDEPIWTIKINTIEDLLNLLKEVQEEDPSNELIVSSAEEGYLPELEIYDSYRE